MNAIPRLAVDPALDGIVRPVALVFEGVRVVERHASLDERLRAARSDVRGAAGAAPRSDTALIDVVAAVRAMYRRVGLDPTKTRPSSEALLRRVRRGDDLPRINSAVDVGNWCSLEFQLPYGLYDLRCVEGDVELRLGRPGEGYDGIRKDEVHVGGRLVVADALGAFGNPTSDSARTEVGTATTRLLVVIYAPAGVEAGHVGRAVETTTARLTEFVGGQRVVGPGGGT